MRPAIAVCVLLATYPAAIAQTKNTEHTLKLDAGASPGKAELGDFQWLVGHWVGDGLGGICEEIWVPPLAGSSEMMGMFRYVKDGKLAFTEHFLLCAEDGTVAMKLKHFDPNFKGWEEKDKHMTFRLVKVEPNAAYFSGLTMKKEPDGIRVYVALKQKSGETTEAAFDLKAAKSAKK